MADFSVDTAKLRHLAGSLDDQAHEARTMLRRASGGAAGIESDDESEVWGPLGEHRGLPDLYAEVLATADATLGRIFDYLGSASEALIATASDYDERERETASAFARIDARRENARRGVRRAADPS